MKNDSLFLFKKILSAFFSLFTNNFFVVENPNEKYWQKLNIERQLHFLAI